MATLAATAAAGGVRLLLALLALARLAAAVA
jgi:hypothetical protein